MARPPLLNQDLTKEGNIANLDGWDLLQWRRQTFSRLCTGPRQARLLVRKCRVLIRPSHLPIRKRQLLTRRRQLL